MLMHQNTIPGPSLEAGTHVLWKAIGRHVTLLNVARYTLGHAEYASYSGVANRSLIVDMAPSGVHPDDVTTGGAFDQRIPVDLDRDGRWCEVQASVEAIGGSLVRIVIRDEDDELLVS